MGALGSRNPCQRRRSVWPTSSTGSPERRASGERRPYSVSVLLQQPDPQELGGLSDDYDAPTWGPPKFTPRTRQLDTTHDRQVDLTTQDLPWEFRDAHPLGIYLTGDTARAALLR